MRDRGDEALREIAEQLGEEAPDSWRVDPEAIAAAPGLLDPEVREAMRVATRNIAAVARTELEALRQPAALELPEGQLVEVRTDPVLAAGVYAPGGRAPYASSVLMCCVPARVAGVARVAVARETAAPFPPTTVMSRNSPSSAVLAAPVTVPVGVRAAW